MHKIVSDNPKPASRPASLISITTALEFAGDRPPQPDSSGARPWLLRTPAGLAAAFHAEYPRAGCREPAFELACGGWIAARLAGPLPAEWDADAQKMG